MPRNVAQSTSSCAARISTEPSITPCGGIAMPTAAKRIAAVNDATDIYFFISRKFLSLSRELSKGWLALPTFSRHGRVSNKFELCSFGLTKTFFF